MAYIFEQKVRIKTTNTVHWQENKKQEIPEKAGYMTTSVGFMDAVTLNLQPASFSSGSLLFSGSRSCNNASASKHSSDDIVKQLESELEEGDTGISRSSNSK